MLATWRIWIWACRDYKYAVTFNAANVPFAPLWNTFNPADKGEVSGTLSAHENFSGVGFDGESLQKTLAGTFEIGTTNLNLDVNKIKSPALSLIVAVVAAAPELANPATAASAISRLSSAVSGKVLGKSSGGLSDDISKSPIDIISARGLATNGVVKVDQVVVRSTVFEADVTGTVTLAPVLTNSAINFPVSILLSQPIAQKSGIGNLGPVNAGYLKLPDFFVEKGTLGEPKASISVVALGKGILQQFVPGLGGGNGTNGSGNLLQGVGNLLRGSGSNTSTNQPNKPATNQTPVNNLLNRFLK